MLTGIESVTTGIFVAFTTGVESFTQPDQVGPMYPFVGWEVFLFIVAVVLWVLWHVWQIRSENREYDEAVRAYGELGMEDAVRQGGAELDAKKAQFQKAVRQKLG